MTSQPSGGWPWVAEVPTFKLKLDSNSLPFSWINLPLCLAVGITALNGFDQTAKFPRDHAKQDDHAVLVDGFMAQAAKVDWIAVGWTIG